jgi:hypothetical protein
MIFKNLEFIALLILVVISISFRFYNLDLLPPGLYIDEAVNGVDTLKNIDNQVYKVFYSANNGREGLFINIQTLSVAIFGNNPWSLRVVSALIGSLTVLIFYFLLKELFSFRISYIASFLLATSFWHVLFSRTGFRAISVSLFLVLAVFFYIKALKTGNLWKYSLSGIFFGLGFYTYFTFRLSVFIFILLILYNYTLFKTQSKIKVFKKNLLTFGLSFFIAFLPMLIFNLTSFETANNRISQVLAINYENSFQTIMRNFNYVLIMFLITTDDYNLRHSLSNHSLLPLVLSFLFYIGIFYTLYYLIYKKDESQTLGLKLFLIWFFVMQIPLIFAVDGINNLRALSGICSVMLFISFGYNIAFEKLGLKFGILKKYFWHFTLVFLILITFYEWNRYFSIWASQDRLNDYYFERLTKIGKILNSKEHSSPIYVVYKYEHHIEDSYSIEVQPIMFLTKTYNYKNQKLKNIFYLPNSSLDTFNFPKEYFLFFTFIEDEVEYLKMNPNSKIVNSLDINYIHVSR